MADLPKRFYTAFGIERGGMWAMFGPKVWAAGLRAALKGNFSRLSDGDLWIMPGVFLAKGDTIIWKHPFHHIGDHPDFNRIVERVLPSR